MPAAIYALSYKDTGCILSYCMLGKQPLTDKASATALRDRLVGDNLVFSLAAGSGPVFKIPKEDVRVDQVQIPTAKLPTFTQQPYKFLLDLKTQGVDSGDGTPKSLLTTAIVPSAMDLDSSTGKFTVKFSNPLGPPLNLYLIIDGQNPVPEVVMTNTTPPTNPIEFLLPITVSAGSVHALGFFAKGIQPFVDFKQAV